MKRKAIRVLFVGALVLSGLQVQSASASPLTVGQSNGWITGDQDGGIHVFDTTSEVKCTTATFRAKTSTVAVNELTVTPSYEGCTAFGFWSSHFNTNGCTYTLTTPLSFGTGKVIWSEGFGQIHIVCPEGKNIEITPTSFGTSVCTQSIGPKTPSGQIIGRSAGTSTSMDLTLEFSLRGLTYKGTGGACGTSGSTGTYFGNSTFKCYGNELHSFQTPCTFS